MTTGAAVTREAPCCLETVAGIIVRGTLRCNSDFADKVCAMNIGRFDRREFDHVKERHEMFAEFVHELLTEFAADEIRPLSPTSKTNSCTYSPPMCGHRFDVIERAGRTEASLV